MGSAGSLTLRPNGSWRLRVDGPPDPATGARKPVSRTFHGSKTDAKTALAELVVEVRGIDHAGTSVTFGQLGERVLAIIEAGVTPSTFQGHQCRFRKYLIPAIGGVQLCDLTASHFDDLWMQCQNSGLAATYVAKIRQTATHMLDHAIRWDWVTRNVASLSTQPKGRSKRAPIPATDELERFLAWLHAHQPTFVTFIDVLADLGCRPAELCALRWCDVDLPNAIASINGSIQRGPDRVRGATKTYKIRTVGLAPDTVRLLEKQQAATGLTGLAYVFPDSRDGSVPYSPGGLATNVTRYRQLAGTPNITMRALRHYVATNLIAGGVDVRTVAGRLGNSPAMVLNVYSEFVPQKDREAADLLRALRSS